MRLAQEHDINLNDITGTGKGGRITRKDMDSWIKNPQKSNTSQSQSEAESSDNLVDKEDIDDFTPPIIRRKPVTIKPGDREIPVTGLRRTIAQNMVRSTTEIPHAWMMIEVDVTNLVS